MTRDQFRNDLLANYGEMGRFGIPHRSAPFFLPPYEWYNDSIATWTKELGLQLVNYTPGTISHADYTTPADKNYRSSEAIFSSILAFDKSRSAGLNGFILLLHIGTDSGRTDKFYNRLPELLKYFISKGYQFQRVDEMLKAD